MISSNLPALQVVVPLFGAIVCALVRRGWLAWFFALAATWMTPLIAGALVLQVLDTGTISYAMGGWEPPIGIEYRVDLLNAFVLLLISAVAAVMLPYANLSVESEIDEPKQAWFYALYLLCLAGLLGIAITGDAFNAFVFLEVSSLATYGMIAMGRDRRALLAAYQYLIMGTIGATMYVIAIGILYTMTGTLNLADMADRLVAVDTIRPLFAALAFITVGVSLKFALFPLHSWLPNAYAYAPTFATAFLAATATKAAVYLILRFFFAVYGVALVFGIHPVSEMLIALSLMGMFGASIVAVFQTNIKRMLAYSSVAQIGYITLGFGVANVPGLTGGVVHLANHAVTKGALFLAVGGIVYRVGGCHLEHFKGIGRRMPLTMAGFAIAGLSIIGVPGTAGFISKWYLAIGALEKGWGWLVILLVLSSLISVVYIGRVIEMAFFREPEGDVEAATEMPLAMMIPAWILIFGCIYFGIETSWTADIALQIANELLGVVQ